MAEVSVRIASPAKASASSERLAAGAFPAPQASVTTTGMRPRSRTPRRCRGCRQLPAAAGSDDSVAHLSARFRRSGAARNTASGWT
jgi:hypothetical protein